MTTFTVTIAGVSPDPEVYGGLTASTSDIGSIFGAQAAKWRALTPDDKARTLRDATLYLDQQAWAGTRTGLAGGDATTLAWPRSGVTLGDGSAVDSTTVPTDVVRAAFQLAVLIANDETVTSKLDQGSNLKSVGGSGVPTVEFFAPTSAAAGTAPRMPVVVQRLVGKYLAIASGDSVEGGFGQGGCATSAFSRCRQLTLVGPE